MNTKNETALHYRDGRIFTGTHHLNDHKRPYTVNVYPCSRCGGAGGGDKWQFTGWTCFDCGGSGKAQPRTEKLYTADQLAKLDAAQGKRDAKRAVEAAAKLAERQAAAAATTAAFDAAEANLLARIPVAWLDLNNERAADARIVGDIIDRGRRYGSINDRQRDLVVSILDKRAAQAARSTTSRHFGQVSDKVSVAVTCINVASYERTPFGYRSGGQETVYICTFDDGAGHVFVTKTPTLSVERGTQGTLRGIIKQHDEYQSVKQTQLTRAQFDETIG